MDGNLHVHVPLTEAGASKFLSTNKGLSNQKFHLQPKSIVKILLEAHALKEAHPPVWTPKMPIFQSISIVKIFVCWSKIMHFINFSLELQ